MKTRLILTTLMISPLALASPVYNFNFYNGETKETTKVKIEPDSVIQKIPDQKMEQAEAPKTNHVNQAQIDYVQKIVPMILQNNFQKSRLGVRYGSIEMTESKMDAVYNSESAIGLIYSVTGKNNYRHIFGANYYSMYINEYENFDYNYYNVKNDQVLNQQYEGTLSGYGVSYSLAKYFPIKSGLFSQFIISGGIGAHYNNGDVSLAQETVADVSVNDWGRQRWESAYENHVKNIEYFGARANLSVGLELNLGIMKLSGHYGQNYSRNFIQSTVSKNAIPESVLGQVVNLQLEVEI